MLRFKPEVRVAHWTAPLATILELATWWSALHGTDVQVNSIADPAPNRLSGSLHPFDLAVDLEPFGNVTQDRASLAEWFRRQLDPQYDVVFESSHVHVEWDARRPPLREIAG